MTWNKHKIIGQKLAVWCGWKLAESSIGTYCLLWVNGRSWNSPHEYEFPVYLNQVNFWAKYALNKRIRCYGQNSAGRFVEIWAAVCIFGLWVNVIYVHFLEEHICCFRKKMFPIFSCRIKVIVTSQSNIPFFCDIKCMKIDYNDLQLK